MTICISIKVPDGLVLAADSMSSYPVLNPATQAWDIVQSYSYANKLIRFGTSCMGALIWGQGSLQGRSMQNLLDEFSRTILAPIQTPTVKLTATSLSAFIKLIYEREFPDPTKRQILGFLVGGYDGTSPFAEQWAFEFPLTANPQEILTNNATRPLFGVQWFGQVDALSRLVNGFDFRIIQAMKDKGFDAAKIDDFFQPENFNSLKIPYEIIFDGMPLQDAVDFAAYLVHIVKGRFRFVVGPKVCGGPVDIAVVKPGNLEWIRRKELSHENEI